MESPVVPPPPSTAKKIAARVQPNGVHRPLGTDAVQRASLPSSTELFREMLQRLHEFVQSSLQSNTTPLSIVDVSTLVLMKQLLQLDEAITAALAVTTDPLDRIEGLRSALDMMLRLAKQLESFGRLRLQLEEAQRTLTQLTAAAPPSEVSQ